MSSATPDPPTGDLLNGSLTHSFGGDLRSSADLDEATPTDGQGPSSSILARRIRRRHDRVLSGAATPADGADPPHEDAVRIQVPATPGEHPRPPPPAGVEGSPLELPAPEVLGGSNAAAAAAAAAGDRGPSNNHSVTVPPSSSSSTTGRPPMSPRPAIRRVDPNPRTASDTARDSAVPVRHRARPEERTTPNDGQGPTVRFAEHSRSRSNEAAATTGRRSPATNTNNNNTATDTLRVPASQWERPSQNAGATVPPEQGLLPIRHRHQRTSSLVARVAADGTPAPPPEEAAARATPTARLEFSAAQDTGHRGVGRLLEPDVPIQVRSVATQTTDLNDGFIARRGAHLATPVLLLVAGPVLLLIGGVSYSLYWRVLYATIDEVPGALTAYVVFLFLGFLLTNVVVFPMALRLIASQLSLRSKKRYLRGASFIYGFLVALPISTCEMLLVLDSDGREAELGMEPEKKASVFALVVICTLGVFFVWLAYVNWMVDIMQRIVRKAARRMLKSEGVGVLHQRPGTQMPSVTKYAIAVSSRKTARKSKTVGTDARSGAVEMGTVARPLTYNTPSPVPQTAN